MKEVDAYTYQIETAGLGQNMTFYAQASCGSIKDGVGFDIGKGGWVISFDDLMEMWIAACQYREDKENND